MALFLKPTTLKKKLFMTIHDFTFYSNGKHDLLTVSQVAEIIEAVDDDIAEHYEQGKEPCNLAIELMRLQTQLFIHRGY